MEKINKNKNFHSCADTFIVKDNKVLLVYHDRLKDWRAPGGHIEEGELPHECAIRESKEETGLDVEVIDLSEHDTKFGSVTRLPHPLVVKFDSEPEHHQHFTIMFLAKMTDENQKEIAKDVLDLKWFTIEALKNNPKVVPISRYFGEIAINKMQKLKKLE